MIVDGIDSESGRGFRARSVVGVIRVARGPCVAAMLAACALSAVAGGAVAAAEISAPAGADAVTHSVTNAGAVAADDAGAPRVTRASPALGRIGLGYQRGRASGDADVDCVFARWYWRTRWFAEAPVCLTGYAEFDEAYWRAHGAVGAGAVESMYECGLTPVLRILQNRLHAGAAALYLEGGVGAHYMSRTHLGGSHRSTDFEFGDFVGVGVLFGRDREMDLGFRLEHFSNGGIDTPNPAVNVYSACLSLRL